MFERILGQIREQVRSREYVMTVHAEEEMEDDGLSILNVEDAVLTGKIVERQKDHDTNEWKYVLEAELGASRIVVVFKVSVTGRGVLITVFVL